MSFNITHCLRKITPTHCFSSCSDGVHRCGLFCAISIIVEMLKTEQIVDIFQVVKALRLHNPDFVTGLVSHIMYVFCMFATKS